MMNYYDYLPIEVIRLIIGCCSNVSKVTLFHTCKTFKKYVGNNKIKRSQICELAAWNGNLSVLKWARENGCQWNSYICASAAHNGHLEVLKWGRENGCDWDKLYCKELIKRNNHHYVVEWIENN